MLRVLISAWPHFLAKHEGRATSQMMAEVAARVETMLLTHGNRQGAARKRRELFGGEGEEVRRPYRILRGESQSDALTRGPS